MLTNSAFLTCALVVLQVWTRRTSSCPPALLCPVGVAPAMVQPVRSKSSAALAALRDPALRRSSDELENPTLPTPPPSFNLSSAPYLQPARPHAALHFYMSSFFMLAASTGEQVILCCALRRSIIWEMACGGRGAKPGRPYFYSSSHTDGAQPHWGTSQVKQQKSQRGASLIVDTGRIQKQEILKYDPVHVSWQNACESAMDQMTAAAKGRGWICETGLWLWTSPVSM